jgi:hypothetical protein
LGNELGDGFQTGAMIQARARRRRATCCPMALFWADLRS